MELAVNARPVDFFPYGGNGRNARELSGSQPLMVNLNSTVWFKIKLRKKSEAQNNLSLNSFACQLLPSPMMELATAAASVLRLARVEPPAVAAVAEVELTRAAITESTSSDLMMMMRSTMMMICCCHCCCWWWWWWFWWWWLY